jgi:hypothetical protein
MATQTMVIERPLARPLPDAGRKPARFPVAVSVCVAERPPAPVRVMDITLKSSRSMLVDGRRLELPYGVKDKITVRALKALAKGYAGSIILAQKGNEWVRLRDHEAIDIPKAGERLELKSLPSFRVE